jgi:nicotinate phosphoribosyltransferase
VPSPELSRSGLLVDLYQLTMGESYLAEGVADREATFSLFFRTLPAGWGYALAAGLEDALRYLREVRFGDEDLAFLDGTGLFSDAFLERLAGYRFAGRVRALPEGTPVFPREPLLELTGPLLEAQIAETMVLNQVHLQTLIASKAARSVQAARGRRLVDFALRRTHGGEAGLKVSRASFLAGFDATSNVLAGRAYGIPIAGTMAHSYIEAVGDELEAFRAFARAYPDAATLLVDTYDTLEGTRRAVVVARELGESGHRLGGIRLDSGDLVDLSRGAREILDAAGLEDVLIFASGGLDEHELTRLLEAGASVDGFGIGTAMGVSADAPYLDMVYKLVELDGRPVLKLSEGKATLPGRKQVWRVRYDGSARHDVLGLDGCGCTGRRAAPSRRRCVGGEIVWAEALTGARERARRERESLPDPVRRTRRRVRTRCVIDPELDELRHDESATRLAEQPRYPEAGW